MEEWLRSAWQRSSSPLRTLVTILAAQVLLMLPLIVIAVVLVLRHDDYGVAAAVGTGACLTVGAGILLALTLLLLAGSGVGWLVTVLVAGASSVSGAVAGGAAGWLTVAVNGVVLGLLLSPAVRRHCRGRHGGQLPSAELRRAD